MQKQQGYEYQDGLLIRMQSYNGESINYAYTKGGQVSEVNYEQSSMQYRYDDFGNIIEAVRDGHRIAYEYDLEGQMLSQDDSEMGRIAYSYDALGKVESHTQGQIVERRKYDALGQLAQVVYGDGSYDTFRYDLSGKLLENQSSNGMKRIWGYDGGARVSYWRESSGSRAGDNDVIGEAYVYDGRGRMSAKIDYRGRASLYEYDEAGRLKRSQEPFSKERAEVAYERYLEAGYFPDTERASESYEIEGEGYRAIVAALGLMYKGDAMENIRMKRGRNATAFESMVKMGTQSDALTEVYRAMKGNARVAQGQSAWTEEYEYDERGNMVAQRNGWGTIEMEYDASNRMSKRGRRNYEYDDAGNIVAERLYEVAVQYSYSGDDRLMSVQANKAGVLGAGKDIAYGYDGLGRRRYSAYKNEDGQREELRQSYEQMSVRVSKEKIRVGYEAEERLNDMLYMPLVEIPEGTWYRAPERGSDIKVTMERQYSYGQDGRLMYAYSHVPQYKGQTEGSTKNIEHFGSVHYTTDVLGSVRGVRNEKGTLESVYEYSAFGDKYRGESNKSYGMAYTGKQEMEGLSGVYNYGYRDYRAVEGRFGTEDPIKDGRNWYNYVGNSPLNFVDPLGLESSASNAYNIGDPSPQTNDSPGDYFCDGYAWNSALDNGTDPRGQNGENWNANNERVDSIYNNYYQDNRSTGSPPENTNGYAFIDSSGDGNMDHMEYYDNTDNDPKHYTEYDTEGIVPPQVVDDRVNNFTGRKNNNIRTFVPLSDLP